MPGDVDVAQRLISHIVVPRVVNALAQFLLVGLVVKVTHHFHRDGCEAVGDKARGHLFAKEAVIQ